MIASAYLTDSLGWRWWYIVFGIVNLAVLVLALLFVVETKYPRSLSVLGTLQIRQTIHHRVN